MRASLRNGKGSSKNMMHNMRGEKLDAKQRADAARNANYVYDMEKGNFIKSDDFINAAEKFYSKKYEKFIKAHNERCISNRHPERCLEARKMLDMKRYAPTEQILQIGDKNRNLGDLELQKCLLEYIKRFNEVFQGKLQIINFSVHRDESTPHVHVMYAPVATKIRDTLTRFPEEEAYPCMGKALEELGINRPDIEKAESRYNNPQISATNKMREAWYEVIQERGHEIDTVPLPGRPHKEKEQYIRDAVNIEARNARSELEALQVAVAEQNNILSLYEQRKKKLPGIDELEKNVINGKKAAMYDLIDKVAPKELASLGQIAKAASPKKVILRDDFER